MKINLSNHVAIGFQQEWLNLQGIASNYLLKGLYESCLKQGIDIVGITAEERVPIEQGSVHDRYGRLLKMTAGLEREGYCCTEFKDSFTINRTMQRPVTFVRGQAVQAQGPNGLLDTPHKVLLFGNTTYIPSGNPLADTLAEAQQTEAFICIENAGQDGLHSRRFAQVQEQKHYIDALVGYDGERPQKAREMQDAADVCQLPWVAIGNQHTIASNKSAYIEIADRFIYEHYPTISKGIRTALMHKAVHNVCIPESWSTRVHNGLTFKWGTFNNRHYRYS